MAFVDLGLLLLGLLLVAKSSELAVKSLVKLARAFGLSEFTISFLIIGVASILPELSLGVISALEGTPSLGLGIIFGSNIADLTIILGIVAMYAGGIKVESKSVASNLPFLFLSALPVLLLIDGELSRLDGVILLVAFFVHALRLVKERNPLSKTLEALKHHRSDFLDCLVIAAVSITVLFLAAFLVSSVAIKISHAILLPVVLVGIIIALGTCLPELSFSLQSLRRNHPELGLGDIVGNVITDATLTLGIIALITPIEGSTTALIAGMLMVAASVLAVIFMKTGARLSRKEGVVLIIVYVAFLVTQVFIVPEI